MPRAARTSVLILYLIALAAGLSAQGLLLDDAAYNAVARQPDYGNAGSKAEDSLLSRTPKVDLRPFCPRPQHQGAIGSCTGWSMGYGAMSILQALQNGWEGQTDTITHHALSALYIYNQVRIGSCQSGAYIHRAAELVKERGNIPSREFDRFKNDCTQLPGKEDSLAALSHRIKDFIALFGTEDAPTSRIEKTKLSLAQGKPVVVALMLRKNFEGCRADPPYWMPLLGDTTFFGAHAMVAVGYDDGREAFEILNSWGEQWGNGGFIWIKYADFAEYCNYGIQLTFSSPLGESDARISGRFNVRIPFYDQSDHLQFRPDTLRRIKDHYAPAASHIPRGSLQQWQVSQLSAGTYMYAFSVQADREVRVHWPRDGQLDDRHAGKRESAIITLDRPGIYLPGEYGALHYNTSGEEYLCFLLSRAPIGNLDALLENFRRQGSEDFFHRLREGLGDRLAGENRVDFSRGEVAFTGILSEHEIVPIVVRLLVE